MEEINRHIKRNNVVILTVLFELDYVIAFVTLKNKKTFNTFNTYFNMLIEMFNLF